MRFHNILIIVFIRYAGVFDTSLSTPAVAAADGVSAKMF